jgi:hypothetical protein
MLILFKSVLCRIEFQVKKEGFGGGGTKILKFVSGPSDEMQLKASGKVLTVAIRPGLPKNSSEYQRFFRVILAAEIFGDVYWSHVYLLDTAAIKTEISLSGLNFSDVWL